MWYVYEYGTLEISWYLMNFRSHIHFPRFRVDIFCIFCNSFSSSIGNTEKNSNKFFIRNVLWVQNSSSTPRLNMTEWKYVCHWCYHWIEISMRFNFKCEWSNVVVVVACVLTLKSIKLIQLWGSMRATRPNTHSHERTHAHTHNNVIKKVDRKNGETGIFDCD